MQNAILLLSWKLHVLFYFSIQSFSPSVTSHTGDECDFDRWLDHTRQTPRKSNKNKKCKCRSHAYFKRFISIFKHRDRRERGWERKEFLRRASLCCGMEIRHANYQYLQLTVWNTCHPFDRILNEEYTRTSATDERERERACRTCITADAAGSTSSVCYSRARRSVDRTWLKTTILQWTLTNVWWMSHTASWCGATDRWTKALPIDSTAWTLDHKTIKAMKNLPSIQIQSMIYLMRSMPMMYASFTTNWTVGNVTSASDLDEYDGNEDVNQAMHDAMDILENRFERTRKVLSWIGLQKKEGTRHSVQPTNVHIKDWLWNSPRNRTVSLFIPDSQLNGLC